MTLVFKKKQSFTVNSSVLLNAISKIEFARYEFTLHTIKHLTEVLRANVITGLSFSGDYFGVGTVFRDFGTLFDDLHCNTTLKKLCFDELIGIRSPIALNSFLEYIKNTKTLVNLRIVKQGFDIVDTLFPVCISHNSSIRKLKLSQLNFSTEDYNTIFGINSQLNLSKCELVDMDLTADDLRVIGNYIDRNSVSSLILDRNLLYPDDDITTFLESVAHSKLLKFSMRHSFRTVHVRKAQNVLKKNISLTYIGLYSKYAQHSTSFDCFDHIARCNYIRQISLFDLLISTHFEIAGELQN